MDAAEKSDIIESINVFIDWLTGKKLITEIKDLKSVDLPSADNDWVMFYDKKNATVSFNTFCRAQCSADYYKSIVLHEFFHLVVQKVPNKDDATRVKDDFGNELMTLIDIEADFYTALFYKEAWGYDLVRYLTLYYQGSQVFRDKWIRVSKLQRYIGTILSICKMFLKYPPKGKRLTVFDLYLVTISPLYTEENMHVLVIRKEHIYFDTLNVKNRDFESLKACYHNKGSLTLKGYIEKLIDFASQALNLPIPQEIANQINLLN